MSKLTPWFSADQKPTRRGVYETILVSDTGWEFDAKYSRWTGSKWMDSNWNIDGATVDKSPGLQRKRWRGLTEDGYRDALRRRKD